VVVFNNARWEMLQAFFPDAGYNTTVPWPFAKLAELWGGRGLSARTPGEFTRALHEAWQGDSFTVIDVVLDRGDLSPILRGFVQAFKAKLAKSQST
jgi:thiamine pyrophosphate-dependent acetolactate synthase large subunit-like protein